MTLWPSFRSARFLQWCPSKTWMRKWPLVFLECQSRPNCVRTNCPGNPEEMLGLLFRTHLSQSCLSGSTGATNTRLLGANSFIIVAQFLPAKSTAESAGKPVTWPIRAKVSRDVDGVTNQVTLTRRALWVYLVPVSFARKLTALPSALLCSSSTDWSVP